jgi:hypothetical protein
MFASVLRRALVVIAGTAVSLICGCTDATTASASPCPAPTSEREGPPASVPTVAEPAPTCFKDPSTLFMTARYVTSTGEPEVTDDAGAADGASASDIRFVELELGAKGVGFWTTPDETPQQRVVGTRSSPGFVSVTFQVSRSAIAGAFDPGARGLILLHAGCEGAIDERLAVDLLFKTDDVIPTFRK